MITTKICTDNCSCLDEDKAKELGIFQANLSCFIAEDKEEKKYLVNFPNTQEKRDLVLRKNKDGVYMHTCGLSSIDAYPIIKHFFPTQSIMYFGMSSKLSGSTENMNIDIEDKALFTKRSDYCMFDTQTVAGGQLILIENAVALAGKSEPYSRILASSKELSAKIKDYFSVDELINLDWGGRLKINAFKKQTSQKYHYLGTLNKEVGLALVKRTLSQNIVSKFFLDKLSCELTDDCSHAIYITFGDNQEYAEKLKKKIEELFPLHRVCIVQASPPVIANTGHTIIGLSFVSK